MSIKDEVNALRDLVVLIESKGFQDYIMNPLYKEMEEMKAAYSCETLRELSRLKGKREGLEFIINLLKIVHETYEEKVQEMRQDEV